MAQAGSSASVNGVDSWDEGLIAYGRSESVEGGVWLSTDGESWATADVPDSPPGTAVFVTDVERVPGGYVAVGTLAHPEGSGPMGNVVWTSPDARSWSEAPGSVDVRNAFLSSLSAQGDTVLAGGLGMWRSTDGGSTWSEVEASSGGSWVITGLRAFEGGFIAAGGTGDPLGTQQAAIWTSPDGVTWARIDFEGDGVSDLVPLPDGRLLAVGEGGNIPLAWLSNDGATWTPTSADMACCITDLAATPTGVVGVGFGPTPGGVVAATTDGAAWLSETGVEGHLNAVIYDERFGVVAGGGAANNAPAVIFGPNPYP